jgi:hypothetical protein
MLFGRSAFTSFNIMSGEIVSRETTASIPLGWRPSACRRQQLASVAAGLANECLHRSVVRW